jgi:hypothetical protein
VLAEPGAARTTVADRGWVSRSPAATMSDFPDRIRKSVRAVRASASSQRHAQRREAEEEAGRQAQGRQRARELRALMWDRIREAEEAGDGASAIPRAPPGPTWGAGWTMRSWQVVLVVLIALMLVVSVVAARSWASGIEARIAETAEQRRETRCQAAREQLRRLEEVLTGATTELHAARLDAHLQGYDATRTVERCLP